MYIYPKEIHLGEGEISGIGPHEWYLGSLTVFLKSHHKTNCWSFPGSPVVKNLPANAGDMGSIPGLGRFHMLWANYACAP